MEKFIKRVVPQNVIINPSFVGIIIKSRIAKIIRLVI